MIGGLLKRPHRRRSTGTATVQSCCLAAALVILLPAYGCNDASVQRGPIPSMEWRISDSPLAIIGSYDERPAYTFSMIRGGLFLPDGRMAIADGSSREIRLFSATGQYLKTLSRKGDGPGEFRILSTIAHAPDGGVCGWDGIQFRLTCFPVEDGNPRVLEVPGDSIEQFSPRFVGIFPDGSFAIRDWRSTREMRSELTGERRDSIKFIFFSPTGEVRSIRRVVGEEAYFNNTPYVWGTNRILFGRFSMEHLDGALVIGVNDSIDLRIHDSSGDLVSRIANASIPVPVRPQEVDSARSDMVADLEYREANRPSRGDPFSVARNARIMREHIRDLPSRPTKPAFTQLRIDHFGDVWIAKPELRSLSVQEWTVLGFPSEVKARIELPADCEILDIAEDRIMILSRDDLDVETVAVFALIRRRIREAEG